MKKSLSFSAHANFLTVLIPVLLLHTTAQSQDYWVILDPPTTRDLLKVDFIDSLRGWAAGDSGTIVMTSDGGMSWSTQPVPVEFGIIDLQILDERFGWALAQQYPVDTSSEYGTRVLRTTNGGSEWIEVSSFTQFWHALEFTDSANGVFGGESGRLFWTSDAGTTWTEAVVDSPEFGRWPVENIDFYSANYGIATGGQYDITGQAWRTVDGGKTWTWDRVATEPVFAVYFFDSLNVLGVGGDLDYGAVKVWTNDSGLNWDSLYLGIWGQASGIDFRTASEGWAPLGFAGTYMYTLDTGRTWTSIYTPDSSGVHDVEFTDSSTGYIVGSHGTILKYVGPPTAVDYGRPTVPEQRTLLTNYPNPFNPSTTIRYNVEENALVRLVITDVTGKVVREVNQGVQIPGTYRYLFDSRAISSGMYICRVSLVPTGVGPPRYRSIKMLLLR
jgi:photosystem II stability/assembly factor-like uncharacterized protein